MPGMWRHDKVEINTGVEGMPGRQVSRAFWCLLVEQISQAGSTGCLQSESADAVEGVSGDWFSLESAAGSPGGRILVRSQKNWCRCRFRPVPIDRLYRS